MAMTSSCLDEIVEACAVSDVEHDSVIEHGYDECMQRLADKREGSLVAPVHNLSEYQLLLDSDSLDRLTKLSM